MQPLNLETIDFVEIVRLVVTDFINNELDLKYNIIFDIDEVSEDIPQMQGDSALLQRMLTNLIQKFISSFIMAYSVVYSSYLLIPNQYRLYIGIKIS